MGSGGRRRALSYTTLTASLISPRDLRMSRLLAVAVAGALVTAGVLLVSDAKFPALEYHDLSEWWNSRQLSNMYFNSTALATPVGEPQALTQLGAMTSDALNQAGWRTGVQFARFDVVKLEAVLDAPWHHTGTLLLIVPGGSAPERRGSQPFLSVAPEAASLAAALPIAAVNSAVDMVESARGRELSSFRLEVFPLPSCRTGEGPCAVWEVSSGRILMDAHLADQMAAMPGLRQLLGQFVGELVGRAQAGAGKLGSGQRALSQLSTLFATAGAGAVAMLLAGTGVAMPTWYCIACPIILGMLAPFLFNFGLTAAADQICQHFQMPEDECIDLWWGAFALAMVMSLGSAIPIVYVCRLPDCVKHLVRPF